MHTKTYKYKLRVGNGSELENKLVRMSGSVRFVWNKMLSINQARLKRGQYVLNWQYMSNLLPVLKETFPFLKEDAYSASLQHVCKDLKKSYDMGFSKGNGCRLPNFKKRHHDTGFKFPDKKAIKFDGNRVKLPKLGWIRFHKSRDVVGEVRFATVTKTSEGWFLSVTCRIPVAEKHCNDSVIGIDMGVANFATVWNGESHEFIRPMSAFRKHEERLANQQRRLSSKKKFSNNWKKQKQRISKLHKKIANIRKDFLHKLSTRLANSHGTIVMEDLKVKNMSKSASGTLEESGRQVAQKRGLNKSILDQGWGMFREMISYKLEWSNGDLILVNPAYTSQKCPSCGHASKENRKTQSDFDCVSCGYSNNADVVGAMNIRAGRVLCGT